MQKFTSKLLGGWTSSIPTASTEGVNEDAYQSATNRTVDDPIQRSLEELSTFRINPNTINFSRSSGSKVGGKAAVLHARLGRGFGRAKEEVAVKKLHWHRDMDQQEFASEFINEVRILARLSHKNIIRLIGFAEDLDNRKAWIVLSWQPNGNLSEFLATGRFEIAERTSLIKDTFTGINYLHTRRPPICHGDLKSLNILVSSSCRAIIAGFNSARAIEDFYEDHYHSPMNGDNTATELTLTDPTWSLRWAAPEVVNGGRQDLASDIWSAAWVCWKIFTNNLPFPDLESRSAITLQVIVGKVPAPHEDEYFSLVVRLCSLMLECWAFYPNERPSVARCCKEIKWMPSIPPSREAPGGTKIPSAGLSHQMGLIHYAMCNHATALSCFKQAQSTAESANDQKSTTKALQRLGDVYRGQSKYAEAEEVYVQARDRCARIRDGRGQANALLGLAHVYRLQAKYQKAEQLFTQAAEIYTSIKNIQGRANALRGLGHVYLAQSKYTEGNKAYAEVQDLYTRTGDDQGRANTLLGMGNIHRLQSEYAEAEEFFTRAQEIYTRIGDLRGQANTLRGLGQAFCGQSKYAEAETYYIQAQETYTRIGSGQGQANVLLGLGHVYRLRSEYSKAEDSFTRAKELCAHYSFHAGQANALRGLSYLRRKQGLHIEAAALFASAGEIYARAVNPDSETDT